MKRLARQSRDPPACPWVCGPDDACNTFAVTYRKLKEFETTSTSTYLENNILFLKAEQL
jgi:iron-sulfur cluster repair protein YtfE (RIC family)